LTFNDPGDQGEGVTGMQGIGVKTPLAAAVAAATVGFARLEHIPKGMMFAMDILSIIVAAGDFAKTLLIGGTTKFEGAKPNEHCKHAPEVTRLDNAIFLFILMI